MDKAQDNKTGIQITALMRGYLRLYSTLSWNRICEIGNEFNTKIECAAWLSTDTGITFDKTFIPDKMKG